MKAFIISSYTLFFVLTFGCLISCGSEETEAKGNHYTTTEEFKKPITDFYLDTLKGIYIGDFGGSDIRLVINYIGKKHAVGYNIHKGLQRNVSGTVEVKENTIELILSEPGDNEFDGVFHINIDKETFEAEGYWKSNSGKISSKHFVLKRQKVNREDLTGEDGQLIYCELNSENFTEYCYRVVDSLGEIQFSADGLCEYGYYPYKDEIDRKEQLINFKGSWMVQNNVVLIDWQKNNIFPNKKSVFKINGHTKEEPGVNNLTGENRTFNNDYIY